MSYWAFWHKSQLILLVITLPSLAVICSLLEILFRKSSRNFNAGHKSAARCWIIEERPVKQTFGACPAHEQRLFYMFPSTRAMHLLNSVVWQITKYDEFENDHELSDTDIDHSKHYVKEI